MCIYYLKSIQSVTNKVSKMNYEAERAMNQKRLRMESEPGHGVVQGNGLPLNYIDNGHQIPYQPYAGAYNTHYPPPEAFAAYGPPPPGGYAPQNLSYVPPAHQNYAHHQSFAQQPQQLHMQSHMVQGYGDVAIHKPGWPPQPPSHLLPPIDTQKPLDVKQLKPEIKLEPPESQKRPHHENEMMGGDLDQPKIKIKTDIFKPDELAHRPDMDKARVPDAHIKPMELSQKPPELQKQDEGQPNILSAENKIGEKLPEKKQEGIEQTPVAHTAEATPEKKSDGENKPFSSPEFPKTATTPTKPVTPGSEPKKRGRPKGSTNKPKPPGAVTSKSSLTPPAGAPRGPPPRLVAPPGRPRAPGYQYTVRPFRKDFSGIQFRRRWSDECLESSHIPNEVYFGDVPVPLEVLYNYYDANAERERLAQQAAHIAAQKAAAAKLAAAKLPRLHHDQVTTVDSSSSDDSSDEDSESGESEDDQPLKRGPGRPKGAKSSPRPAGAPTPGKRGRPPVPPELRQPGIMDMKKFCKAAGIRFDYKKLVEGCTKNKERVQKMLDLLIAAGLEGKPTMEKCQSLKKAKMDKREQDKAAKKEAKSKVKEEETEESETSSSRRMTRGATGVKPRQRIVISSDEEDDTPAARRTLSKLRSSVNDDSPSP